MEAEQQWKQQQQKKWSSWPHSAWCSGQSSMQVCGSGNIWSKERVRMAKKQP